MTLQVRPTNQAKPTLREADPTKDKPPEQKAAQPLPEQKRSKTERLHEARGYWAGVVHGACAGIAIGLFAMFIGFQAAAVVTADLAARLDATRVARDAALGGR